MNDELKPREWSIGERAAWLADKIVTGSPDYCNEAASILREVSTIQKESQQDKATIAMLREAADETINALEGGEIKTAKLHAAANVASADTWLEDVKRVERNAGAIEALENLKGVKNNWSLVVGSYWLDNIKAEIERRRMAQGDE